MKLLMAVQGNTTGQHDTDGHLPQNSFAADKAAIHQDKHQGEHAQCGDDAKEAGTFQKNVVGIIEETAVGDEEHGGILGVG